MATKRREMEQNRTLTTQYHDDVDSEKSQLLPSEFLHHVKRSHFDLIIECIVARFSYHHWKKPISSLSPISPIFYR